MGCGRGAVLIAVAKRLPSGRATGIDLWSTWDQSGNASDVTRRNATIEGVLERVAIETGDMRSLPFVDGSFDLVLSSLAIHNIRARPDRAKAVAEAWRVLKPGGRLLIADVRSTALYAKTLDALGAMTTTSAWMALLVRQRLRGDDPGHSVEAVATRVISLYFFSSARAAARMFRSP
jgi:arsenite methyltransferase